MHVPHTRPHTADTRSASCKPRAAAPQAFSCLKCFTEQGMRSSAQQSGGVGWEPPEEVPLAQVGPGL